MRYITVASGSALLPKLAGTYELEIAASVEDATRAAPDVVVNIGAAEGYYAVGCARRVPSARIVALDSRRSARWLSRRLAQANGVAVEAMGEATHAVLRDLCAGAHRPLIICDIDGGERDLLDPVRVPELSKARLLVETHDSLAPGVTEELTERFSATHADQRKRVLPGVRHLSRCLGSTPQPRWTSVDPSRAGWSACRTAADPRFDETD